jgi:hypothetical protein
MPIVNCIYEMPCWYILIIIIFSLYYGIRAIVNENVRVKRSKLSNSKKREKNETLEYELNIFEITIIQYIQEFLFKVIITISSFMALWVGHKILISLESFDDIGVGTAILLIFLFAWGIIGAAGYLTMYISAGKLPGFTK